MKELNKMKGCKIFVGQFVRWSLSKSPTTTNDLAALERREDIRYHCSALRPSKF